MLARPEKFDLANATCIYSSSMWQALMSSFTSRNHLNRESSSTPRYLETSNFRVSRRRSRVDAAEHTETVAVSGAQSAGDCADAAGSLQLATRQVLAARTWRLWSLSLEDSRDQTASSPTVELIRSTALHSTSLK